MSLLDATPAIRDDDLLQRVGSARPFMRAVIERQCRDEQLRRDKFSAMPAGKCRRATASHVIHEEKGPRARISGTSIVSLRSVRFSTPARTLLCANGSGNRAA